VSAHTKAIVVGRQVDRKIVARTSRFPFNKKVGQLLIEHGVLCECAHSPTIQSVNTYVQCLFFIAGHRDLHDKNFGSC
jgi:hypothetical protein